MDNKLVNQTALTKLDQENLAEVISKNLLRISRFIRGLWKA